MRSRYFTASPIADRLELCNSVLQYRVRRIRNALLDRHTATLAPNFGEAVMAVRKHGGRINQAVRTDIGNSVLCWLATVDAAGVPNVTPKEIFTSHGDDQI